jgi:excisionase family DNA binding protein
MATRADGVTIREAAQALGITEPAVRQRLQRRTLRSYRAGGRVYVILPDGASDTNEQNGVSHGVSSDVTAALHALVAQLKSENALIRDQLVIKDQQISELHVLLQTAQRQLNAGPTDTPPAVEEEPQKAMDEPIQVREHPQRPWWKFWR